MLRFMQRLETYFYFCHFLTFLRFYFYLNVFTSVCGEMAAHAGVGLADWISDAFGCDCRPGGSTLDTGHWAFRWRQCDATSATPLASYQSRRKLRARAAAELRMASVHFGWRATNTYRT